MGVRMIAEFRKRPSVARRQEVKRQREAELDRIVQEEVSRATRNFMKLGVPTVEERLQEQRRRTVGFDPAGSNAKIAAAHFNPRSGEVTHYVWGS